MNPLTIAIISQLALCISYAARPSAETTEAACAVMTANGRRLENLRAPRPLHIRCILFVWSSAIIYACYALADLKGLIIPAILVAAIHIIMAICWAAVAIACQILIKGGKKEARND